MYFVMLNQVGKSNQYHKLLSFTLYIHNELIRNSFSDFYGVCQDTMGSDFGTCTCTLDDEWIRISICLDCNNIVTSLQ